ncbi:MAG: hypothetical protein GF341_13275 [candidate division Zixibacteria bacterium]|nr:hypothetical protein [candidate division Zixibacteria bacterium]
MRVFRTLSLAIVAVALTTAVSFAAVPQTMNVQGRLTDSNGDPVVGNATLIFKIYPTPTDPRELWPQQGATDESHAVTLGPDGLWSVEIGTQYPIATSIYSDSSRWLEVQHQESGTVFPRIHMSSGAYSFRVSTVDNASGGDIFGDVFLHSTFYVGALGDAGNIIVRDETTFPQIKLTGTNGQIEAIGGIDLVETIGGDTYVELDENGSGGGMVRVRDEVGNTACYMAAPNVGTGGFVSAYLENSFWPGATMNGWDGNSGRLELFEPDGSGFNTNVVIDANAGDGAAALTLHDGVNEIIRLDASGGGGGAGVNLRNSLGNQTFEIDADEEEDNPAFRMRNELGTTKLRMQVRGPNSGGGSEFFMWNHTGQSTVEIDGDEGDDGVIRLSDSTGSTKIEMLAAEGVTGAQIALRNKAGAQTIIIDAEHGQGGSGRVITQVLQITGGSDLSEQFDISAHHSGIEPAPGMVVCLDSKNPGKLVVSGSGYDRKVAGIVSGAGGVAPGMLMGQHNSEADGQYPVALTGRVYVMVDASNGPIQVGDLLTTSDVPGHAMRVADYERAQGAIIGKAMEPLNSGRGLVLTLVNLQ